VQAPGTAGARVVGGYHHVNVIGPDLQGVKCPTQFDAGVPHGLVGCLPHEGVEYNGRIGHQVAGV
jgi:hypothetical protein